MDVLETNSSRRNLFTNGLGAAAAVAAASAVLAGGAPSALAQSRPSDQDILNFALNLEYLEGEFYMRAITGQGLDQAVGGALGGSVRGGRRVAFSNPRHRAFIEDVARNELAHVNFIRTTLGGSAVQRPAIDFDGGFAAVAKGAGLGAGFDPFADEQSFFLAAYLFEDVGVTAYKGAAPLLSSKQILEAAAGIAAVEAYHAGCIRTVIYKMGAGPRSAAGRITELRIGLNNGAPLDEGVESGDGRSNIVPARDGIAYSRSTQQVLNIVLANAAAGIKSGGFFPEGLNGRIQST